MGLEEVGWGAIALAQDRDRRRAVVDAVMNLKVSIKSENFFF